MRVHLGLPEGMIRDRRNGRSNERRNERMKNFKEALRDRESNMGISILGDLASL